MYKGKEICQGCKKSGKESTRASKDSLCRMCEDIFMQGLSQNEVNKIKIVSVFIHYYDFYNELTNKMVHDLFKSIHINYGKYYTYVNNFSDAFGYKGSNGQRYNIDERLLEPLKKLFHSVDEQLKSIQKERESIPKLVNEYISLEKDRIYNEGIKKGKQLILMLNSGEISINDFEYKKYNSCQ